MAKGKPESAASLLVRQDPTLTQADDMGQSLPEILEELGLPHNATNRSRISRLLRTEVEASRLIKGTAHRRGGDGRMVRVPVYRRP